MKRSIMMIAMVVLMLSFTSFGYSGGSGTAADPYQIATKADLLALAANTADYNKCFILTADIDMEGQVFTTAIIAAGTYLYGFQGTAFTGTFDGNGHKITHFTINGNDYIGLFGYIGGSVKNLGLENFTVSGSSRVGGLAGDNRGSISNCFSTGTVASGGGHLGGLVGQNWGTVSNCYSTGAVSGSWYCIGGLVGNNWAGSISNCYSTGMVSGQYGSQFIGGLVGWKNLGSTVNSFWDIQTSGWTTSNGGTGKTTAEMKQEATFTNWDFDTVWNIVEYETYPFLKGNSQLTRPAPQLFVVICGSDERGQRFGADAQAIYNVLIEYPGVKAHNLRLVTNPNELSAAIAEVTEKLHSGDQLWFYYSGHGYYGYDGSEPAIWNSPLVAFYMGELKNEGDEYLDSVAVSDDLLTIWLSSSPKLQGVQKVVILDSCMSGGFWGRERNEGDTGDLDKLQNIGLIAACREGSFAYSYRDWSWLGERRGRGMFSYVLTEQLKRGEEGIAPADLNHDGTVSFEELSTTMRNVYAIEEGSSGVIRSFPWLEGDIEVDIDANEIPELCANHAADFDPNVPIIPKKLITDLNGDWVVDLLDFTILISHWLEEDCNSFNPCAEADLDRSGTVNFIDFAIFANNWLEGSVP